MLGVASEAAFDVLFGAVKHSIADLKKLQDDISTKKRFDAMKNEILQIKKQLPYHIAEKNAVEKAGGKFVSELYYTLVKYDIVTTVEAPNDEAIASLLLATASLVMCEVRHLEHFQCPLEK